MTVLCYRCHCELQVVYVVEAVEVVRYLFPYEGSSDAYDV